jgi:hypothetical protein
VRCARPSQRSEQDGLQSRAGRPEAPARRMARGGTPPRRAARAPGPARLHGSPSTPCRCAGGPPPGRPGAGAAAGAWRRRSVPGPGRRDAAAGSGPRSSRTRWLGAPARPNLTPDARGPASDARRVPAARSPPSTGRRNDRPPARSPSPRPAGRRSWQRPPAIACAAFPAPTPGSRRR